MLGSGLINLKIEPEVSQIDTTHPVAIAGGISVPALIVRRASTTVELRDGQSFVIAGLLQNDNQNPIDQLPWLGSVPVLGALFSSKSYQKNETDLAIIVTPHLVRPARPGDVVKTPADDTLPPNDADFSCSAKPKSHGRRPGADAGHGTIAAAGSRPFTGHMLDMPKGGFPTRRSSKSCARFALAVLFSALAGCSEYIDRRDNVALGGGNAVATNKVTQMVDPGRPPAPTAHRLRRRQDGNRRRTLSHRPRDPAAGHRHSGTYQPPPQQQNNTTPVGRR